MDKSSARRLVEQTFQAAFEKPQFATFVTELLKRFDRRPAQVANIPLTYRPTYVETAERIGTYSTPSGDLVLVVAVNLARDTTLFRARTALRDFAGYLLDRERADAALIAFVPPDAATWRFSYVKLELSASLGASGRASLTKEVSPARRLSFLVGAQESCHTAKTRFLGLLTSDVPPEVADIEAAFNVESVTQEFFDEYKELFLRTKESLADLASRDRALRDELRAHRVDPIELAKKLLGQIVFLYFIQKKGWLGVKRGAAWGSGPHDFLRRLYAGEYVRFENFFDDVLEPLFYESLAADRDDAWDTRLNCRIPFLNGGLFEPLHGYDWKRTKILLPNALFHNAEVNASGDVGTGILDVFNRYNFTVNEAEPLEKEVAIDPEMLGKVFENLLDVRERRSKGSFYTPREIVHYMCQEALINFLDNVVNGPETTPILPFSPSQPGLFGQSEPTQTALTTPTRRIVIPRDELALFVRSGDQAALREVVRKEGSKSYARELPKSIEKHAAVLDGALAKLHVCDPAIGSGAFVVGMMSEIVRARAALNTYLGTDGRTAYDLKRHAIHHSLYGVDIDAGAVEIAKLRLWLSLVVDEVDVTTIKPLPNLDYKIVAGNSLLGFPFKSAGMRQVELLKDELTVTSDADRKDELRRTIDREIQRHLAGSEKALGHRVDFDFRVFFSEVFAGDSDGFDVVIANPPYVSAWDMPTDGPDGRRALERRFSRFKILEGHWDLYVAFVLQGFDVLRDHGVLTYVLPNPVLREKYARKLRRHVLNDLQLSSILTFQETNMFKNVSRKTVVLVIDTASTTSSLVPLFRYHEQAIGEGYIALDREIDTTLWRADPSAQFRIDATEDLDAIATRMESSGTRLGDACYVNYGAQLASKEKGVFRKKDIVGSQPRGNAKPFYDGKDLQRWGIRSRSLFVDYRKDRLYGPRTESLFESPKIAIRNISDAGHRIAGTFDPSGQYCDHTVVLAVHYADVAGTELRAAFEGFQQMASPPPLEFIAAALLSKPITFYYRLKNSNESLQQATSHVFPQQLRALPLPTAKPAVVSAVVTLVRKLLSLSAEDSRRGEIDAELDILMFDAYGVAADRDAIEAFLAGRISREAPPEESALVEEG